jgi:polyisoprenoid-binding protein YceI
MKNRIVIALCLGTWFSFAIGALRGETFNIDPVHSSVLYRIGHVNVGHSWGRFNDLSGTIKWDDANPSASAIDVTIKSESIDSGAGKRDEHLRSPDFLNAKQFPTITFKSEKIRPIDAKTYEVTGTLTLHGVSHPLTVKLERLGGGKTPPPYNDTRVGLESTFEIKRSDFEMKNMLNLVADDVQLIVSVEGAHR